MTYLYRLWDEHDRLLYVGISKSAIHRLHEHLTEQPWAEQIVKQTIERHNSREEALQAETLAIKNEAPVHNVIHNSPARWETTKRSRYVIPAQHISYGDLVSVKMTRNERLIAKPVRTIDDVRAHKLLNDVLCVVNDMVLSIGKIDPLYDGVVRLRAWERMGLRAFDDLVRSLPYLPYGDCCEKCSDNGENADLIRWPVAVIDEGTYVYVCHKCQAVWTCWYAGAPVMLDVKS